jgi:putative N-acetylmannosamine-6-phosphate epimerase
MSFMQRSAKYFLVIKAAREIKKEIEKAGLDDLKILAEAGISIVGTYLQGCSEQQKAQYKHDLNALARASS